MLHNKEAAPYAVSIFSNPQPNEDVKNALLRLTTVLGERMGEKSIYQEQSYRVLLLNGSQIPLGASSLVLVLFYSEAPQRILELTLDGSRATLHFHK